MKTEWWEEDGTPDPGIAWWAVEHNGHPAFYLRALMAGDFAPGRGGPLQRHIITLDGDEADRVRCGSCGQKPGPDDLVPIERTTGLRHHLDVFRRRRAQWPQPTDESTCWKCSTKSKAPSVEVQKDHGRVRMCPGCAKNEKAEEGARRRAERAEERAR